MYMEAGSETEKEEKTIAGQRLRPHRTNFLCHKEGHAISNSGQSPFSCTKEPDGLSKD